MCVMNLQNISNKLQTYRTMLRMTRTLSNEYLISEPNVVMVKGLSNNKACEIDGITYEHLKYGGKLLEKHLCSLFNMIFDKCVALNGWKTSMIIPLHKGGSKPKTDCDAYRGISLICKVFEKLLDCRIDERLNNFPNTQQMAYQKCLNSMFASFDLQEVIHYYIERHSAVIVTFLDSMKAFDTVSHNGLKVKLFDPFMQSLIDICVQYSKRWKFKFSPVKSQVMKFTNHTMHINLRLDNNNIPECKTLKHVGIILENGFNSTERTITACRLIRSLSMSIIKQGIHPSAMNPIVCSKIILQLCYTKALYGCELWNNLTNNAILLLERAHRYVCKYVQGLPKLTRTDKCTTLLGWTSIGCYIDSKKLLFLGSLCNMPSRFLSKQIFITCLLLYLNNCTTISGGFIPDIKKIVRKYDLFSYVDNFVKTSSFPSSKKWKYLLIKSSVIAYEEHCLHARFNIDTDITYFRLIQERILPHRPWTVLKSHKQLRTQCQYVVSLCALVKENYMNYYVTNVACCTGTPQFI